MSAGEIERLALRVQLAAFPGRRLPAAAAAVLEAGLGGVCLFGSNTSGGPDDVAVLVDTLHAAGERVVVAVDEEGGDVTRLHARTGSPSPGNAVLGAVDDVALTRRTAHDLGLELAGLGIDLDLAPVADVNSNPANPIIGVRSFGSDPQVVGRHVAAWVEGLQSAGVAACVKHFPGHGDTDQDSHAELPVLDLPPEVLRARELVPFAAAVDAGVAAAMTSHIVLRRLDPELPGTLSAAVIGLLRDDLGFDGAVVTDALDMAGASGGGRGIARAAVMALAAGADLLCLGADKDVALVREVADAIVSAVRSGHVPEQRLRAAAQRVDRLAEREAQAGPAGPTGSDATAAQVRAARRALRVEGALSLSAAPLVVRVDTAASIAVGEVPWGLPSELVLDPAELASAVEGRVRAAADGRPVVVQVRDLHRRPDAHRLVALLVEHLADVTLVEWGWPAAVDLPVTRICTYGASTASRTAVGRLLEESTGWRT